MAGLWRRRFHFSDQVPGGFLRVDAMNYHQRGALKPQKLKLERHRAVLPPEALGVGGGLWGPQASLAVAPSSRGLLLLCLCLGSLCLSRGCAWLH